ncbi:hypothetical protein CFB40_34860 [Burkholderia sp. AU31652]|uniref:hypothetical protein n=1 Tax=Burkholderia sp. AU31652 TaxID=2015354 RepID=UPI000B79D61D|nr:hypothetical protein [Burkholderia sp. AU31652]OXI79494.1 hypothetical protein CFB40_34860 [Burkholderia sp. AU31652]
MSKTTIIATIGPASRLARRRAVPVAERVTMVICAIAVLASLAMLVRLNLKARAGAPLYERAMTAFIGVYVAVVLAKTLVFA